MEIKKKPLFNELGDIEVMINLAINFKELRINKKL